jgi:hypothetical protein
LRKSIMECMEGRPIAGFGRNGQSRKNERLSQAAKEFLQRPVILSLSKDDGFLGTIF